MFRWRLYSNVCAVVHSVLVVVKEQVMLSFSLFLSPRSNPTQHKRTALRDLKGLTAVIIIGPKINVVPKNLFPSHSAKTAIVIGYGLHYFAHDFI